jgi:hypothetical protein
MYFNIDMCIELKIVIASSQKHRHTLMFYVLYAPDDGQ